MIQNIGCQILGISTTDHLGCEFLVAMLCTVGNGNLAEMDKQILCGAVDGGTH
jgi:hypothetical protein